MILPSSKVCHISELIILYYHRKVEHSGRGFTVNEIRNHGFWILSCVSSVSSVINKCIICRKLCRSSSIQHMSDLPSDRVTPAPDFCYSGVDYFGPFIVTVGRKTDKKYGALFTCLFSREVHIKVTHSLSADSFITAFKRFTSVRG